MRLAVYNVENLFNRAKVMNHADWAEGQETLKQFADLNTLLGAGTYTNAIKTKMVILMEALGLEKKDQGSYVILRRNRGALVKRPQAGGIEIIANGRADWVGSLELLPEPINHQSMLMTARVIRDVKADILGVVEAESRPALKQFSDEIVSAVEGTPYENVMLIDGNDDRGIDVGIAYRDTVTLDFIRSHVTDKQVNGNLIFSRDCPEYHFRTPNGKRLLIMVNHFKSKGFGSQASNDAKRKAQAQRVREIYDERLAEGIDHIAIIGDLNDTPDSNPLEPLHDSTSMKDIFMHPNFDNGGFPGTFDLCNASNKIDYILLSPKLFERVNGAGVFRKGMWPGVRPARWEAYDELEEKIHAGSDHACLFMDFNL
ncbi:MAG: endonuclease/exonuclease/phosphatase family protein [Nitrospira sp.]